jgi:hypothetical protein
VSSDFGDVRDVQLVPAEAVAEGLDDGVVPCGGEGGHVQGAADVGASAADGTRAVSAAGVVGEGCHADQGADASVVGRAQLAELGDEGGGQDGPDAGGGLQEGGLGPEVTVGLDQLGDLAFQGADLCVEGAEDGVEGLASGLAGGGAAAVAVGRAAGDQLSAAGDRGVELGVVGGAAFGEAVVGEQGEP